MKLPEDYILLALDQRLVDDKSPQFLVWIASCIAVEMTKDYLHAGTRHGITFIPKVINNTGLDIIVYRKARLQHHQSGIFNSTQTKLINNKSS